MKWKRCDQQPPIGTNGDVYYKTVLCAPGRKETAIAIWLFRRDGVYYGRALGNGIIIETAKLKKATNFKEAAKIILKRLRSILNTWLDELKDA